MITREEIESLPKKILDQKNEQLDTLLTIFRLEQQLEPLENEANQASIGGKNAEARKLLSDQFLKENKPEYKELTDKINDLKNLSKRQGLQAEYHENMLRVAGIVYKNEV